MASKNTPGSKRVKQSYKKKCKAKTKKQNKPEGNKLKNQDEKNPKEKISREAQNEEDEEKLLTRMKAFRNGGRFLQKLITKRASYACRNRFPLHFNDLIRHAPKIPNLNHVPQLCMPSAFVHKRNLRPFFQRPIAIRPTSKSIRGKETEQNPVKRGLKDQRKRSIWRWKTGI